MTRRIKTWHLGQKVKFVMWCSLKEHILSFILTLKCLKSNLPFQRYGILKCDAISIFQLILNNWWEKPFSIKLNYNSKVDTTWHLKIMILWTYKSTDILCTHVTQNSIFRQVPFRYDESQVVSFWTFWFIPIICLIVRFWWQNII